MRLSQSGNLISIHMYTVGGDTAWTKDVIGFQAIYHTHTIACQAIVLVGNILCHMNMKTNAKVSATSSTAFKCSRTEGKGRVQAIAGGNHPCFCLLATFSTERADEALIL